MHHKIAMGHGIAYPNVGNMVLADAANEVKENIASQMKIYTTKYTS